MDNQKKNISTLNNAKKTITKSINSMDDKKIRILTEYINKKDKKKENINGGKKEIVQRINNMIVEDILDLVTFINQINQKEENISVKKRGRPPKNVKKKNMNKGDNISEGIYTNNELTEKEKEKLFEDLIVRDEKMKWDSIIGHQNAKNALMNSMSRRQLFKELFKVIPNPPKGILLYGPPGTGKTSLAIAAANSMGAFLYKIKPSDVFSQWRGTSEKRISAIFEFAARGMHDKILLFDEVEAFASKRFGGDANSGGDSDLLTLKTQLLQLIDEFGKKKMRESYAFLIAITNFPKQLDPAFKRRFQRMIYVGLPYYKERLQMIEQIMKVVKDTYKKFHGFEVQIIAKNGKKKIEEIYKDIAEKTILYSQSDIKNLFNNAISLCINDVIDEGKYYKIKLKGNNNDKNQKMEIENKNGNKKRIFQLDPGREKYIPASTSNKTKNKIKQTFVMEESFIDIKENGFDENVIKKHVILSEFNMDYVYKELKRTYPSISYEEMKKIFWKEQFVGEHNKEFMDYSKEIEKRLTSNFIDFNCNDNSNESSTIE